MWAGAKQRPVLAWCHLPVCECGWELVAICAWHNGLSPLPVRRRAREGKSSIFQASFAHGRGGSKMNVVYTRCAGLDMHKKTREGLHPAWQREKAASS